MTEPSAGIWARRTRDSPIPPTTPASEKLSSVRASGDLATADSP